MIEQFKKDVDEGLSQSPKTLNSKYFYDKIGDELFIQIMNLPEYYLTRSELEIFQMQSSEIIKQLEVQKEKHFELIELGAGDGQKTKILLQCLQEEKFDFTYTPIDISKNALDIIEAALKEELPELKINKLQGDYFGMLESLKSNNHPKVLFFLGSNLGNMTDEIASKFIYELGANLNSGDKLLLGLDLIKDKSILLPAYNDNKGITCAFNLNLLRRINRELGGNFDLDQFSHQPQYDETEGVAKSFIVSKKEQEVFISSLEKTFHFKKDEPIATEISRKYNDKILQKILEPTDLEIKSKLTDQKGYFADYILEKK